MSINSALLAGVSGLVANSSALASIANNIANANTVGYKTVDTNFSDIVNNSGVVGDADAGGVLATSQQLVTQQGTAEQTTSNTDLSIVGQGFFVTTATSDPTISDARNFTRAGSFTVDANGDLENAAGQFLQGWPVNPDGSVTVDPSNLASLQTINVGNEGGIAAPTTQVNLNANLDASQPISAAAAAAAQTPPGAGAYNAATNNMASYDPTTGTGVKPDFTMQIPISDSQGGQHTLQLDVLKTSSNTWSAELVAVPASDVQDGTGLNNGQISTGTISFNADGSINMANSSVFGGTTSPTINIGASATPPAAGQVSWATSLGIGAQKVNLDVDTAPGGISQFASASITQSVETNGTQFGNLTGVTIDDSGFVTATYDNGVTRNIAQVAVATFPNPDGLTAVSGDSYQVSTASGNFNLKEPGTGGAGSLDPSTLEASTVDLSQQFAGLITTQQAYSASAKILTTADQMLQALINIQQ
ncbi:flagellar hook protein FlgE [Caulobacter sp. S45]|uniref:flagellar hook protein FlgE n=1 Tax=Caulobacter sp. S45 TaxID=1641861 RepID=UPI00131DF912|nr:flagellar hook protein FlgE [Caulobacter sp. S45]